MSDTRTMAPTQPLTVTLEAQQWDQVLRLLHEVQAPLRITGPLVQAITSQCVQPRTMRPPMNGADEAAQEEARDAV